MKTVAWEVRAIGSMGPDDPPRPSTTVSVNSTRLSLMIGKVKHMLADVAGLVVMGVAAGNTRVTGVAIGV